MFRPKYAEKNLYYKYIVQYSFFFQYDTNGYFIYGIECDVFMNEMYLYISCIRR
jgi:hypothetical protein